MNNTYYNKASNFGCVANSALSEDSEIFIVPPNINVNVQEASIVIDSQEKKTTHFYKLLRI